MGLSEPSSCKKNVLITAFAWAAAVCCVAQNGIPIDVLQNDPYFRNGSTDTAVEESEEPAGTTTTTDEATEDTAASADDTAAATAGASTDNAAADNGKLLEQKAEPPVEIPQPIPVDELEKEEPVKDSKIDVALGYMAFYTYEFQPGGVASYFDMTSCFGYGSINPYGASAKVEFMTLPSLIGVNGIGFDLTWSRMHRNAEHYTLKTNLFTANVMLAKKMRFPHSRILLELHVGGGGMLFAYPTFTYETGYEPQRYSWIYPEAIAGFAFQNYFTRHWGLDITVDAVWPFLIEVPFPVAQVTVASGWHF